MVSTNLFVPCKAQYFVADNKSHQQKCNHDTLKNILLGGVDSLDQDSVTVMEAIKGEKIHENSSVCHAQCLM